MLKVAEPLGEAELLLSLQLALKCADLGHTAAFLPVHLKWVSGLEEEVGSWILLLMFQSDRTPHRGTAYIGTLTRAYKIHCIGKLKIDREASEPASLDATPASVIKFATLCSDAFLFEILSSSARATKRS